MTPTAEVRTIWIFGAGGHGREVAWLAREALPDVEICFVVDDPRYAIGPIEDVPVRELAAVEATPSARFVTAIGDPVVRRRAAQALAARGLEPVALIHPRATVAPGAIIEAGAIVAAGSVVSVGTRVGAHAIVNLGCTLSHDVQVGDFATISPGVHIAGNVVVGGDAFIGVGASVVNGSAQQPIVIGPGSVIGAGAVVIGDVAPNATIAGVPARPIRSGVRP